MTKSTITREQAQKIIVAADEVITALTGTNEDVHPDDSKKMCELWDDLNDRHAPPVVVRELARMALAAMDSEPVATLDVQSRRPDGNKFALVFSSAAHKLPDDVYFLYRHAQPAPVVEREPIAWLNDAYLARGVVDGEAGSEDAGPGYIPVYREAGPQPAPVVPDEAQSREAFEKWCTVNIERNKWHPEFYAHLSAREQWAAWNACRAAMLKDQPQNAQQNIPEIIPNELIAAVNRLLDSNGSRGCYSAIKCYDAHIEVERLLAAARQEVKP